MSWFAQRFAGARAPGLRSSQRYDPQIRPFHPLMLF